MDFLDVGAFIDPSGGLPKGSLRVAPGEAGRTRAIMRHSIDHVTNQRKVTSPVPRTGGPLILVLALAGFVLSTGCERARHPNPGDKSPTQGQARMDLPHPPPDELNVVFLVIDAAAARYLGCHGNDLNTSPNIDALAAEATVFGRAYSQAAWTLPSVASFFVSRYPPPRTKIGKAFLKRPIAALLHDAGLYTMAFSESPLVVTDFGMDTGFDEFIERFPREVFLRDRTRFGRIESDTTVEMVVERLNSHQQERFFLYVHLLPPHAPYAAPSPFGGRFDQDYRGIIEDTTCATLKSIDRGPLRDKVTPGDIEYLRNKYQENLAYADHQVGRILQELRARKLMDETLLVVTSDHGEAFMEHGRMMHNHTVYEEMIHVPLIVRFPPCLGEMPAHWDGVVELVDLLPTICHALEVPIDVEVQGRSLLPVLRAGRRSEGLARSWTIMPHRIGTAIQQRYKLIKDSSLDRVELYDRQVDPDEKNDIAQAHPELVKLLLELLESKDIHRFRMEDVELDQDLLEKLKMLGYADDD